MVTTQRFIQKNEETVRRFMKAMVDGIHYYKHHKSESMKVMGKYMRSTDPKIIEIGYDFNAEEYERKPYPSVLGIQSALEEIAHRNPRAREAKAGQFFDGRFVRELDQSGFIDGLYRDRRD
jgi:ABC-type nitrate/sulfonate/bicarbonate transport system substrate-binding protein